jgi:diguanylate cyclase (GGDEF)-like protein
VLCAGERCDEAAALNDVLVSAADEATVVMESLVDLEPADMVELRASALTHRRAVEHFAEQVGGMRANELLALIETRADIADDILALEQADRVLTDDPARIASIAQKLLAEVAYLRALNNFADQHQNDTVAAAQQAADAARADQARLVLISAALVAGSLLLVLLASSAVLRPIRRLRRRADAISAGQSHLAPLPLRGPSEIRALADTMNAVTETLETLEQRATALAEGQVDEHFDDEPSGSLGQAIRKSMERMRTVTGQLQISEQRSSAIIEHAAVGIWTIDAEGRVLTANACAEDLLGMSEDDQRQLHLSATLGQLQGEVVVPREDREVALLVDNTTTETAHGDVRMVIARDITERRNLEQRLARQARRDDLTGLTNRYATLEWLSSCMAAGRPNHVMFIDIDGFKSVNDSLGHRAGDEVLAEVARRLRSAAPDSALVSRLGGDEFLVVVEDSTLDDILNLGARLVGVIERPLHVQGYPISVSASVGVGSTADLTDPLDAIHRADSAVYQAKLRGRGRVEVFDSALHDQLEALADMEFDLRKAVERNELRLDLQPIFDLATDRVVAVEALLRWHRPGHGLVSPGEFIPVAERSGAILSLERWVLREACRLIARWSVSDMIDPPRMAVNISGRHLMDADLQQEISDALASTGADPRLLEIEITESELLGDMGRACDVLNEIRSMGVQVAVDDFGTGFSSMAYLRQLPIDVLKVDRSFVSGAGDDAFSSEAVRAMVRFGEVLGVAVVAEGVETTSQLDFVRRHGCDRAQGFLLARPMPVGQIDELLRVRSSTEAHATVG